MRKIYRIFLWLLLAATSISLLLDIGLLIGWWWMGEPVHSQLLKHWPWNVIIVGILVYNLRKSYKE